MNPRTGTILRVALVAPLLASLALPAGAASWWGKRDNREGLVAMVRNRALLFQKDGPAKPAELNDAFQAARNQSPRAEKERSERHRHQRGGNRRSNAR